MRSFPSLSRLSCVRKCCNYTTIVPRNLEQEHLTVGNQRISSCVLPSSGARRRIGSTGRNTDYRHTFGAGRESWHGRGRHVPVPQVSLAGAVPARSPTPTDAAVTGVPTASHNTRPAYIAAAIPPMPCAMTSDSPVLSTITATLNKLTNGVAIEGPASVSAPAADGAAPLGPPFDQHITSDFLSSGPSRDGRNFYLIVLNYFLPAGLLHVWPLASFRVCADGGCNRLYDELPSMMPQPPPEVATFDVASEDGTAAQAASAQQDTTATDGASAHVHMSEFGSVKEPDVPSASNGNGQSNHPTGNGNPHHANGTSNGDSNGCSGLHVEQQRAAGAASEPDSDWATTLRLAYLPDVVLGDLDSLRSDVRQYYVQHGVPFMDLSHDQDTNDLAKAITLIEERCIRPDPDGSPDRHQILVLGALGGRLDHTLANLNALHMFPHLNVTLWGDGNLVRLVRPGRALITPDERFEGPTCGLIPIAGPVTATSSGLKWNVASTTLRVGGLVSSSNLLTGSPVEVCCNGPLLWTTEVRAEPRPDLRALWARAAAAATATRKREAQLAADARKEGVAT